MTRPRETPLTKRPARPQVRARAWRRTGPWKQRPMGPQAAMRIGFLDALDHAAAVARLELVATKGRDQVTRLRLAILAELIEAVETDGPRGVAASKRLWARMYPEED